MKMYDFVAQPPVRVLPVDVRYVSRLQPSTHVGEFKTPVFPEAVQVNDAFCAFPAGQLKSHDLPTARVPAQPAANAYAVYDDVVHGEIAQFAPV